MAASLWLLQLPAPPPHNAVFSSANNSSSPSSASALLHRKHAPTKARGSLVCSSSVSSSSSSVVTKDQEGAAEATSPAPVTYDYRDDPNFRGCKGCGREETERGCNGEGRIMGGIAAVPLFGWWPIKAYRPCPGFVASGGRYRRYGQSMDDVIAGKGRKVSSNKKMYMTNNPGQRQLRCMLKTGGRAWLGLITSRAWQPASPSISDFVLVLALSS